MKINIHILTIILIISTLTNLSAQSKISKFNNLAININDTAQSYKILITGHLHGSSNNMSGYPASSLLGNLDLINGGNYAFMICLGDLFMNPETDIDNYHKSFFSKISTPLFNAVGNHDVYGNTYKDKFGRTFFSFSIRTEKFIFIDTEINNGNIESEQLTFFKNEIANTDSIQNIFIFMHRPLWAEQHPQMKNLFKDNTRSLFNTNYNSVIKPLLNNIPSEKKIYMFAGSMGISPAAFFYHNENNITYIATAIRDLPKDAFLETIISHNNINFNTISLNRNPVRKLEEYNLNFYNIKPSQSFNWKLLPLYIKNTIVNHNFWIGFLSASMFFVLILLLINRIKNKLEKK